MDTTMVLTLDFKSAHRYLGPYLKEFRWMKGFMDKGLPTNNFKCAFDNLYYKNISNALHVLCGLRPVPTVRKTLCDLPYSANAEIDELSKQAMVKLTNLTSYTYKDKKGETKTSPVYEIISGNKGFSAAPCKTAVNTTGPVDRGAKCKKPIFLNGTEKVIDDAPIDWDMVEAKMGSVYGDFINMCLMCLDDNPFQLSVYKVIEKLNAYYNEHLNDEENHVRDFFDQNKVPDDFNKLIIKGKTNTAFLGESGYGDRKYYFVKYVLHSPEAVLNMYGKIYIKITDNIYNMIMENGQPCATILDGGLLSIERVDEIDSFNWDLETIGAKTAITEKE